MVCRRGSDRADHLQLDVDKDYVNSAFDERNANVDWSDSYVKLGGETLFRGVDGWSRQMKHKHGKAISAQRANMRTKIDLSRLNFGQAIAVSSIMKRYESRQGGIVFIYGTAGTGKSHVIKTLRQIFADKILISAPTACAAQVVDGGTWQSNFPLPVKHLNRCELKGTRLATWQKKLQNYLVYVLEEVSMANADLLGWWDYVLRVIHVCDEPFGGRVIVFCGDHGQLPLSLPSPRACSGLGLALHGGGSEVKAEVPP